MYLVTGVFVSACTSGTANQIATQDTSFSSFIYIILAGETEDCKLPCWNNLRVGESTVSDIQASKFLEEHFVDDFTCNSAEMTNQLLVTRCMGLLTGANSQISFNFEGQDKILTSIDLWEPVSINQSEQYSTNFGQAATWFGQPEAIRVYTNEPMAETCKHSYGLYTAEFELLYPTRGLIVYSGYETAESWPCVFPDMKAGGFTIMKALVQNQSIQDWYHDIYRLFGGWQVPYPEYERFGAFVDWGKEVQDDK